MKRVIIASVLSALSLVFCFYSSWRFRSSLSAISDISDEAMEYYQAFDDDGFIFSVNKMLEVWSEKEDFIEMIISHNETDYIDVAMEEIPSLMEKEDYAGVFDICEDIKSNIKHLIETDKITLGNVF